MKRKSLLFLLLLAVFAPRVAQAQETTTLTVFEWDGTTTNSKVPVYGYYADHTIECQMVYPANALTDMASGTISALKFYTQEESVTTLDGTFQVWIKEIDATTLSSFVDLDGAAMVYEGTVNVTNHEMVITFNNTYGYCGGNLLVSVYETETSSHYATTTFYGQHVEGASLQFTNNGSNIVNQRFLPKTTFTYESSEYKVPVNLAYDNVDLDFTRLTWNAPDAEPTLTGYVYNYKMDSDENWSADQTLGPNITECQIPIIPNTRYNFRVKAMYGANSSIYATVNFTSLDDCMMPENLTVTDVTETSATFNWTEGFGEGQWQFGYKTGDDDYTYIEVTEGDLPLTLDNLMSQTTYDVVVSPLCNLDKTATLSFTTLCSVIDLATLDNVTWREDFEAYPKQRWGFGPVTFSDPCWVNEHLVTAGEAWGPTDFAIFTDPMGTNSTHQMEMPGQDAGNITKLVLPEMTLPDSTYQFTMDIYRSYSYKVEELYYDSLNPTYIFEFVEYEGIRVLASANGEIEGATELAFVPRQYDVSSDAIPAEEATGWYTYEFPIPMEGNFHIILLGESQGYAAIHLDNFVVEPITTKRFTTAGAWDVDTNWTPEGVPTPDENVSIEAAAIINDGVVANANFITIDGGSITIEEGGQLIHNSNVEVSMTLSIDGYGRSNEGYSLISAPVFSNPNTGGLPVEGTNLTTDNYDLYAFDQYPDDGLGLEWRNFKAGAFNELILGDGYLYASENTVNPTFTGIAIPTPTEEGEGFELDYEAASHWAGWNLLGNPYTCNVNIKDEQNRKLDYYTLNEDGSGLSDLLVQNEVITPGMGFFVEAVEGQECWFYPAAASAEPMLEEKCVINVTSSRRSVIDRAIIRFGEGRNMKKFQLNPNHTKVYIPQDGKDYAVLHAESQGELPLNFKAEENGSYTLSFNTENVELGYMHLIDNMTGSNTDLLANPSYTFDAKTTDYASRFKLVFSNEPTSSDSFAFYSNGNLVVNNEGEATLQVVDVMGRILNSESINGCANVSVNAAPGVYMLRLINGDNVKVQKVIVK